jgi:transposase-like protein
LKSIDLRAQAVLLDGDQHPARFCRDHAAVVMRRRLKTTSMLERLNREIKRRTRVASLFPNDASLLLLVSAILMETSVELETGKKYLMLEAALLPN